MINAEGVWIKEEEFKRIEALGEGLANALRLRKCTCKRKFIYTGTTVEACGRCIKLIAWEKRNGAESSTEANCNSTFI